MLQGKGDLRLSSITHLGGIVTLGALWVAACRHRDRWRGWRWSPSGSSPSGIRPTQSGVRLSRRTQPQCRRPGIQRREGQSWDPFERWAACAHHSRAERFSRAEGRDWRSELRTLFCGTSSVSSSVSSSGPLPGIGTDPKLDPADCRARLRHRQDVQSARAEMHREHKEVDDGWLADWGRGSRATW